MGFFGLEKLGFQDSATGTTTDDYADALDWNCAGFGNKTIILANTHESNDLKYQVLVIAAANGQEAEEVAEATLAAGNKARIPLNNYYYEVKVQVKAAAQATYQIDYGALPP